MPTTQRGRLGIFSDAELEAARRRGHVDFLQRLGIRSATNGRFNDIYDKALRRRVADEFAAMTDDEFDSAWRQGHIQFLADAWGAQPDYFRRLRTQPYRTGPGWKRRRSAQSNSLISAANVASDLDLASHIAAVREYAGRRTDRLDVLARLNEPLKRPAQLAGVFRPRGHPEQFRFMLIGEMPSLNQPFNADPDVNYNFDVTTRDRFLQEMMVKYGVPGSYVTDIVKERDVPRRPTAAEVKKWLPFLLAEIEILKPKVLVILGKRTYRASFKPWVEQHVTDGISVDWVFHYSRNPKVMFERRFAEVINKHRSAGSHHR